MIDYMIMEAVALKISDEDTKAQKAAEKREWKKDNEGLDKLRELAG